MRAAVTGVLATLLLAATPVTAAGDAPATAVSLLPLANSSGEPRAPALLAPVVAARLEALGFQVRNGSGMEEALRRRRIRYTDSLSHADARALAGDLDAGLLLVGRVLNFRTEPEPVVGFTLRLVEAETGVVLWARSHCRMGSQYRRLLGLGEIADLDKLMTVAVEEAFAGLDVHPLGGVQVVPDRDVRRMRLGPNPTSFVRQGPELDQVRTIGILPLQNHSGHPNADRIVRDILVSRLWATGRFRVLEPGELRTQILRRGLFPSQVAGSELLGSLRDELGLDALVSGVVLRYVEAPPGARSVEPEVELGLRMISTDGGTILWDAMHERRGDDAASFYTLGRIHAADRLAQAVIDDLLVTLEHEGGRS